VSCARILRTIWRRRLTPAALVVAAGCLAALAVLTSPDGVHRSEPPPGRALPAAQLATERPPAQPPSHRPSGPRRPRSVHVVDSEAAPPRRIAIPAIGVSARIVLLRLEPDGAMETPGDWGAAGWYEPGQEPGERGPAVIVGHVDSYEGPAIFYRLRELRRGDLIRIARADGSAVRFRVEGLEHWPKATFPTRRVFGSTPTSTLRLVTCSGEFDDSTGHYVDNTIVYAVRVPVSTGRPRERAG